MWKCIECNEFNEDENLTCWNCKTKRDTEDSSTFESDEEIIKIEERYPVLRIVSSLYKAFAWITIIIAVLVAVLKRDSSPILLGSILGGLITFISLLAVSEGITVFIDIEENTRTTALIKMVEYNKS